MLTPKFVYVTPTGVHSFWGDHEISKKVLRQKQKNVPIRNVFIVLSRGYHLSWKARDVSNVKSHNPQALQDVRV